MLALINGSKKKVYLCLAERAPGPVGLPKALNGFSEFRPRGFLRTFTGRGKLRSGLEAGGGSGFRKDPRLPYRSLKIWLDAISNLVGTPGSTEAIRIL